MAKTSTQDLVDRLMGGRLGEQLIAWDNDPAMTIDAMARRLETDLSVFVSRETVRRWLKGYKSQEQAA